MVERRVGVLGATSLVGECLLPLLTESGFNVTAFSRRPAALQADNISWRQLAAEASPLTRAEEIPYWICVAPIWVLPDYFELLSACGARRVIVLSSTSRYTKEQSPDHTEQAISQRLIDSEHRLQHWADSHAINWVILRPTLIYGRGRDKNISEIAHFIQRFGFFPLLGAGRGLRQPVHVDDVARICLAALDTSSVNKRSYNISGGETLPYREMVTRVFTALGRRPRLLCVPATMFKIAAGGLRLLPRYRHWTGAMAIRMNQDLVFEHSEATRDLGYQPRSFTLSDQDLL